MDEAIALPSKSVVSSPHLIVNFTASLPSAIAWSTIALASSETIGSTCATESHIEWVYRPKRHVVFTDRSARLMEDKIILPKVSSILESMYGGVDGNAPGLTMGGLGLDGQALKGGVLGVENWVPRSRALVAGNCPVHRGASAGLCPGPEQDV